jgi:hypothetical protein
MYFTAQKRSGRQDDSPTTDLCPIEEHNTRNSAVCAKLQILYGPGANRQILLATEFILHGFAIKLPISLRPGPTHCRAPTFIQNTKLDSTAVNDTAHNAVQGVDLTDKVPLRKPANSRVAGHFANGLDFMGE